MDETVERITALIRQLEKERNSKILPILMDGSRQIDYFFVSEIYNMMEGLGSKKVKNLDVIIHSGGGYLDPAYHAAIILRNYCENLTFIVPRWAKSAATLLACGGNSIIMSTPSELGPLDTQILDSLRGVRYSPLSIKDTITFLDRIEKDIRKSSRNRDEDSNVIMHAVSGLPFMEIGDHLRSLSHVSDYLHELLTTGMFKDEYKNNKEKTDANIQKIIKNLVAGHHSHAKCIHYEKARQLGLKVNIPPKKQWLKIWEIFSLFEQSKLLKCDEQ